ncbi:MAG TPA: anti-sigma factor [Opitutaceae bacterium]|nr:anti-sigma factor [Opitutaceae bacterium]
MMDERTEELASLYVLGLLEDAERLAFEQRLANEPELKTAVDGLREVSAQLAHVPEGPPPPAELKGRILASIRAQSSASRSLSSAAPRRAPSLFWIGWGVAAGFAFLAFWTAQRSTLVQQSLTALQTTAELERAQLKTLQNQLEAERLISVRQNLDLRQALADASGLRTELTQARTQNARQLAELQSRYDLANFKVARLASLLGNSPEAVAIAVWNPLAQEGVLTVEKLATLASDQDYQLWLIDPQYPAPVSGGVFTIDAATGTGRASFRPTKPILQAAKFAISRERKGGAPGGPEGPIVLISD